MKEENNFNIFIIGIGNENRKDDAIGIKVISVLEKMALSGVQLIKIQDDITDLLNLWANARLVILIDAVISDNPPGTIIRIDANDLSSFKSIKTTSTHSLSIINLIQLAKILGTLPEKLIFYGIEIKNKEVGFGIDEKVEKSIKKVVSQILLEINQISYSSLKPKGWLFVSHMP